MANLGLNGPISTIYPASLGQCVATVPCNLTSVLISLTAEAAFTNNFTRSAKIVGMLADIPRCQFLLITLSRALALYPVPAAATFKYSPEEL
jgi:hypothetical protein